MTEEISALNCVSAPVFALSARRDGAFLVWNASLSAVTGMPAEDVIGRTPVEVLGAKAAALSLAPPGLAHVPKLGLTIVERSGDVLVGTLQDREREAYISMAAHDLRAPLRNILVLAETALSENTRDPNLIAKMTSVARNGLALTTELVGSAQALSLGEQPMTEVSLREMTSQIIATLEHQATLECSDVRLQVEKPVLTIVLRNLLDNAVRHGGARRRIKVEAKGCHAGIELRVLDNGTGFKESALAFLSGGEFRLESGYGLFGLQRLLHARGCRLAVEPAETGRGSTVVVTLPGYIQSESIAIAS